MVVGRLKVKMELINNEKSRKMTFKKRKEGLIKKLHQLTTLCDVSACMIISEAAPNNQEPVDIWPRDPEKVRRIIRSYRSKKNDFSSCTKLSTVGLSDFFRDRQKRTEEELVKLRRKNMEARYPLCHEILNTLTETQLREFGAELGNKVQIAKSRIEFLKKMRTKQEFSMDFAASEIWNLDDGQETASSVSVNHHHQNNSAMMMMDFAPEILGGLEFDPSSFQSLNDEKEMASSSSVDHDGQNYSMVMMMMNENFEEFEYAFSSINDNNFQQCSWENLEEDVFQYNDSLWS